jgi:1-deoxy-D-xylulose-5-phosphate reductoisomerase
MANTLNHSSSREPVGVTILGATGSIGVNTLDVISRHPQRYRVIALTADGQDERLLEQCQVHHPRYAVMANPEAAQRLHTAVRRAGLDVEVLAGNEGLEYVVALPEIAYVMAAIVGSAGLRPTLAAARAGKRILLANKEALVMSGRLLMDEVRTHGAELLPIDSEHNAIFQCLPADLNEIDLNRLGIRRILLTASGGPFRTTPMETLQTVTLDQACAHPNWVMGRKISVDSATMMNKGLEVIEACWLFNTSPDRIQVVLHPQSVIHSMVEYTDGSVLAQMGNPDMRIPIAHALAWPERIVSGAASLDLFSVGRLDFEPPDLERFPCLRLALDAARADSGSGASTVLNAANEVAVAAFLHNEIRFTEIAGVIEHTMNRASTTRSESLNDVLATDAEARALARQQVQRMGRG